MDDKDTKVPEQEDPAEKALRVEQDSRVARQKAEAEAEAAEKPDENLNQDG